MKAGFKNALGALFALSLIIVTLYAALAAVAFDREFYRKEYAKHGVYGSVGMEEGDLLGVTGRLIDYLRLKEDKLNLITRVNGQERPFFSENELAHMEDVRILFAYGKTVFIAALAALAVSAAFLLVKAQKDAARVMAKSVLIASVCVFALSAVVLAAALIDFDGAFTVFHKIFFRNDLWILNPRTDLLINIVPLEFFIDAAAKIALLFYVPLAAFAGLSGLLVFRQRKKLKEPGAI